MDRRPVVGVNARRLRLAFTRIALVVGLGLPLAGCFLQGYAGAPPRPVAATADIEALRPYLVGVDFARAHEPGYRDAIVSARIYAIDIAYGDFEATLLRERGSIGFLSTMTIVGLTQTSALMTPEVTKSVLAAIAGGVAAARDSYDKEVLVERTVQALQSQMRANRARVATRILLGLRTDVTAYPLVVALQDVEEYYRAGTIAGALNSITETVATEAVVAERTKDAVISTFARDKYTDALAAYIRAGDTATRYREVIVAAGVDFDTTAPHELLYSPKYVAERRRAAEKLRLGVK